MAWIERPSIHHPGLGLNRSTSWLEVLFDVVLVASIAKLGIWLSEAPGLERGMVFVLVFLALWWIATGNTVFAARFPVNDAIHQAQAVIKMMAVAYIALNIRGDFISFNHSFIVGFIVARLALLSMYFRVYVQLHVVRAVIIVFLYGFSAGVLLWIIALFFEGYIRYILIVCGILFDFIVPWVGRPRLQVLPLDASHLPERMGLFTMIVIGESFLSVILGVQGFQWSPLIALTMFVSFGTILLIWKMYFGLIEKEKLFRRLGSAQPYIYVHIPITLGIVLFSISQKFLIVSAMLGRIYGDLLIFLSISQILWMTGYFLMRKVSMKIETDRIDFLIYSLSMIMLGLILWLFNNPVNAVVGMLSVFFFFGILETVRTQHEAHKRMKEIKKKEQEGQRNQFRGTTMVERTGSL